MLDMEGGPPGLGGRPDGALPSLPPIWIIRGPAPERDDLRLALLSEAVLPTSELSSALDRPLQSIRTTRVLMSGIGSRFEASVVKASCNRF